MFNKILKKTMIVFALLFVVSCGEETTTSVVTTQSPTTTELSTTTTQSNSILPDLNGLFKNSIGPEMDEAGIQLYTFVYETDDTLSEDQFIRYGNALSVGDSVSTDEEVVVYIATSRLILPDLSGMEQSEIISTLFAADIQFQIEVITDNSVPDQTFSGYGDGLSIGDLIPASFQVTVYVGYNSTRLPDLEGMIKEEIIDTLDDLGILYTFQYTVNDAFAEDIFAGYEDYSAGDFYEDTAVLINLYQNTFTSNETSLMISKYVDGGDDTSDQAIELYNPTTEAIDLSDYHLAIYTNGSMSVSYQIEFDDVMLQPGETYLIVNIGANGNLLVKADLMTADLVFDGNDTIQLRYANDTYIDTIYNIGNKDFIFDNEVFIRSEEVVRGTRSFTFNEWNGFVPTYIDLLGTHPVTTVREISFTLIPRGFDDPLGGMDSVILSGSVIDGDTSYFYPGFLGGERVRFLGVDTPETYPYVDDWGPEAKAYTTLILNNAKNIYIQSDPDLGTEDTYGRHLGLVWVDLGTEGLTIDILASDGVTVNRTEHLSGWILLNYHLVLNGYSYNYYGSDSTLEMDHKYVFRWFQEAERYAQENGLGIHE